MVRPGREGVRGGAVGLQGFEDFGHRFSEAEEIWSGWGGLGRSGTWNMGGWSERGLTDFRDGA